MSTKKTDEKRERFILNHNAGPKFQGMVVYKSTIDGKITVKTCNGTEIKDEEILRNFDKLATPYGDQKVLRQEDFFRYTSFFTLSLTP